MRGTYAGRDGLRVFNWRDLARRAVEAGLGAAVSFIVFSVLWFGIGGKGWWKPLNLVAHTFWSGAPIDGRWNTGAELLGLVVLLVAGVVVMAPFTLLAIGAGLRPGGMVGGAAVYTNVVWIFGHYWIWPGLDSVAAHEFSPGVAWLAHMAAGLIGGSVLAFAEYLHGPAATAEV
jgi:hypothetical protein